MKKKAKIVGCGLSGILSAVLLKQKGYAVKVYETRNHIGGNCYDANVCGVMMHNYGPHIFHTDDEEVFALLSKYTDWTPFALQPKGNTSLGQISLPYSRKTISEIGRELSQQEIVDVIFKDYSEKQWGVAFDVIPKTITNRIPKTADCVDPTWFEGQKYQCIPTAGYTAMFERMLEDIEVVTNCGIDDWKDAAADLTVYTGKIDAYYNYRYGQLPYRTLQFSHKITAQGMTHFIENENNNEVAHTRTYDHRYFTPEHKSGLTVVTTETPAECKDGDVPFYPIPWGDAQRMYARYEALGKDEKDVVFAGRLATYKYLDMWMAVKQVMVKLRKF
jgi:UDP-galactopyranose mutase